MPIILEISDSVAEANIEAGVSLEIRPVDNLEQDQKQWLYLFSPA
jgi:hypothetical protein